MKSEEIIEQAADIILNAPSVEDIIKKDEEKPKDKKQNFFSKVWNKTIFPSKIKAKREEKALRNEIQAEARKEAIQDMKPQLVEAFKQQELDKITGKKKNLMGKLGEEFGSVGKDMFSDSNKIVDMMGVGRPSTLPPQQQPQQHHKKKKKKVAPRPQAKPPQRVERGFDFKKKVEDMLK